MLGELIRSSAAKALGLAAAAGAILAGSALVAWPAWYLATSRKPLFNFLLAALAALLVAAAVFRALRRRARRRPDGPEAG